MRTSKTFHYEDFAVGQKFSSRSLRMEKDRIIAFATEFDPQPQHLGEQEAANSQSGRLVASGWHTAAVSMRLFVEALPPMAGEARARGWNCWLGRTRSGRETSFASKPR